MKVLLLGNSQIVAIRNAIQRRSDSVNSAAFKFTARPVGSGREILAGLHQIVENRVVTQSSFYHPLSLGADTEFGFVGVAAPLYSLGLCADRGWLNFRPPGLPVPGTPVSRAAIAAAAVHFQRKTLAFVEDLRRVGVRVFVIEAARLFAHHDVLSSIGLEKVAAVDSIHRSAIVQHLHRAGIPFVPLSASVFDAAGFMLDRYRSETPGDQNHGNAELGEVVLSSIEGFLATHGPVSAT